MGLYHGGALDAASILEQFWVRHREVPTPSVDALATRLDGLLAESVEQLTDCSARQVLPVDARGGLVEVIYEVCRLKDDLAARGVPAGGLGDLDAAVAGLTRRSVAEAERIGLFTAFRDRCASLAGRADNDAMAEAAVDELFAGVRLLCRSVNARVGH
jgi:hypothetical protein